MENALCLLKLNEKRIDWHMLWAGVIHVRCYMGIFHRIKERGHSGFRDGRFNILVATDVAARGLDIPNVDLVSDLGHIICRCLAHLLILIFKLRPVIPPIYSGGTL